MTESDPSKGHAWAETMLSLEHAQSGERPRALSIRPSPRHDDAVRDEETV